MAALAASISANGSGRVDGDLFKGSLEVSFVYLNSKEYDDAKWSVTQVHEVDLMSATGLAEIVREKEAKAAEYARCDAYWLLIVVDWTDPGQEQEISAQGIKVASNVFERIIVYKPGFENIVEMWP